MKDAARGADGPGPDPSALQARIDDLEVKAAFMEDQVDKLDQVVVRQQQQIDLLIQEVTRLKQQPVGGDMPTHRSLRDDLPPHY